MSGEPVITVRNLSKHYRVYRKPADHLKELFFFGKRSYHHTVSALDDVSFTIYRGDRVGILGENGSGKSTLLKILSDVLTPTAGTVSVKGRVTSLLELGTGFNNEISGRENVYQNGMLMGYSREEMEARFPQIYEFSELGDFIDQPVKTYSSGMMVRLAFSCAVFVDPDILIIDEALSVGDAYFQSKCFFKIKSLLEKGITFLYVTHSYDSVKNLCKRGFIMDRGKLIREGDAGPVSDFYLKRIFEKQNKSRWYQEVQDEEEDTKSKDGATAEAPSSSDQPTSRFLVSEAFDRQVSAVRTGTGEARIRAIEILDASGSPTDQIPHDQELTVRVYFELLRPSSEYFSLGVAIADSRGVDVLQFSSFDEGVRLNNLRKHQKVILDYTFRNILAPGAYTVNTGLADLQPNPLYEHYNLIDKVIDFCPGGIRFEVPHYGITKSIWGKVAHPVKISRVA